MAKETIDLHIYVPAGLAAKLKAQAESNRRSVTAEVTFILAKAVK